MFLDMGDIHVLGFVHVLTFT